MAGFDEAITQIEGIADRMAQPALVLERVAELGAEATRASIEAQGLVGTGELLESVYAEGAEFGAAAPYAAHVHARKPFVPVASGELAEPLATEVRDLCELYVLEGR